MTEGATINTKLGLLVNTLNDNRPNIPVLFMKKTSKKYEYSIGSKVVVINKYNNASLPMLKTHSSYTIKGKP